MFPLRQEERSPPGSSVHEILQARILEWVANPSPGVFPTQGLNPGLLHHRQILYHLSHREALGNAGIRLLKFSFKSIKRVSFNS